MEKKSGSNFCSEFCIIGFPDEIGIQNVNGRLGAKAGPAAFYEIFNKMNGLTPLKNKQSGFDMVEMTGNLEKNYHLSAEAVKKRVSKSLIVGIGGGHDYAYPWISAIVEARSLKNKKRPKIGCINLDAHFDLRAYQPLMTSGSPFRRLIDEKWIDGKNLIEFGIQEHCNVPVLWDYARKQKVKTVAMTRLRNGKAVSEFRKALQSLKKTCDEVVISLDLDSISLAFCPGVSAPQGEGFTASEVYQMLEIAGADKKVTSLGVFELSPPLDHQNQTARVAAQSVWHFLDAKFF
jgi:formimidoylglutamase